MCIFAGIREIRIRNDVYSKLKGQIVSFICIVTHPVPSRRLFTSSSKGLPLAEPLRIGLYYITTITKLTKLCVDKRDEKLAKNEGKRSIIQIQ